MEHDAYVCELTTVCDYKMREMETLHTQLIDVQYSTKYDFLVVNQSVVTGTNRPPRLGLVAFESVLEAL